MVSQALLNELKIIIQEDYGIQLEQEVVAEIGNTLVDYFELLARIEYQTQSDGEAK